MNKEMSDDLSIIYSRGEFKVHVVRNTMTLNKTKDETWGDELCAIKMNCHMSSQGKHLLAKELVELGHCFVLGEED